MAPSHMENQQEQTLGQGYSHKKFNCGYSHKKLGMRILKRQDENVENITEQNKTTKPSKGLFRPYALDDDNTPRKRKISRSSESSEDSNSSFTTTSTPQSSPMSQYYPTSEDSNSSFTTSTPQSSPIPQYYQTYQSQQSSPASTVTYPAPTQTCPSPALSPNSYAMRLQRQRAALYMRYMSQFQQNSANPSATPQAPAHYATMGYPNVTAPIFNSC